MLDTLRSFLAELTGVPAEPPRFADNDYRLAAAALLVHVMGVDGTPTPTERDKLRSLLRSQFNLNEEETDELIAIATQVDNESVDLYGFTSLLNRTLDEQGRLRIVEMMWEIIYADRALNEFEDNLVWRAADLLGISANDRLALRQRVRDAAGAPPEA